MPLVSNFKVVTVNPRAHLAFVVGKKGEIEHARNERSAKEQEKGSPPSPAPNTPSTCARSSSLVPRDFPAPPNSEMKHTEENISYNAGVFGLGREPESRLVVAACWIFKI